MDGGGEEQAGAANIDNVGDGDLDKIVNASVSGVNVEVGVVDKEVATLHADAAMLDKDANMLENLVEIEGEGGNNDISTHQHDVAHEQGDFF